MTVSQKFTPGDHPPGVFTVASCLILAPARYTHQFFLFLMRTKSREAGRWVEVSWLDVSQLLAFLSFGGWFNIPASYWKFESEHVALYFCAVSLSSPYSFSGLALNSDGLDQFKSLSPLQAYTDQHHLEMASVTTCESFCWLSADTLEPDELAARLNQRWWPALHTTYIFIDDVCFFLPLCSSFPELG